MKHAGDVALDTVEDLLVAIRRHEGLKEKKRGTFYRRGSGFLHFHEDPAGMFADLKTGADFGSRPTWCSRRGRAA
jgi:hypothetical protein